MAIDDFIRGYKEGLKAQKKDGDVALVVRCKDCKHCEHWYADKGRCFLWHEDGIDVFEDGFCSYAERREDEL